MGHVKGSYVSTCHTHFVWYMMQSGVRKSSRDKGRVEEGKEAGHLRFLQPRSVSVVKSDTRKVGLEQHIDGGTTCITC